MIIAIEPTPHLSLAGINSIKAGNLVLVDHGEDGLLRRALVRYVDRPRRRLYLIYNESSYDLEEGWQDFRSRNILFEDGISWVKYKEGNLWWPGIRLRKLLPNATADVHWSESVFCAATVAHFFGEENRSEEGTAVIFSPNDPHGEAVERELPVRVGIVEILKLCLLAPLSDCDAVVLVPRSKDHVW